MAFRRKGNLSFINQINIHCIILLFAYMFSFGSHQTIAWEWIVLSSESKAFFKSCIYKFVQTLRLKSSIMVFGRINY